MNRRYIVAWEEGTELRSMSFSTTIGAERFAVFTLQRGFWPHVVLA
jgi:hypothetical protein